METPISSSPRSSAGADETFSVPVPHRWVLQRLLPLWAHPLLPAPPDQNMGKRNQQGIPTWGNGKWIKKDSFSQPTSWFHGQQDKSIQKCGSVPLSKSTVIMPITCNGLLPVVTHQQQNGNIVPSFISNTQPWFLGAVEWTGGPGNLKRNRSTNPATYGWLPACVGAAASWAPEPASFFVASGSIKSSSVGDGSKPWYLVNPKIAGKWMFIPLKMYL